MTDNGLQMGLVLDCADPEALAELWACSEHASTWVLMTDPEGNEFCVCDGGRPG